MNVFIASSWRNRQAVRALALELRGHAHEVYDFTDPASRSEPEIPPERYPEQFDPARHAYGAYLDRPEWRAAVMGNRRAIERADVVVLLLPCGVDATADWALGVGLGKRTAVVGHPGAGERSAVHLWADALLAAVEDVAPWLEALSPPRR